MGFRLGCRRPVRLPGYRPLRRHLRTTKGNPSGRPNNGSAPERPACKPVFERAAEQRKRAREPGPKAGVRACGRTTEARPSARPASRCSSVRPNNGSAPERPAPEAGLGAACSRTDGTLTERPAPTGPPDVRPDERESRTQPAGKPVFERAAERGNRASERPAHKPVFERATQRDAGMPRPKLETWRPSECPVHGSVHAIWLDGHYGRWSAYHEPLALHLRALRRGGQAPHPPLHPAPCLQAADRTRTLRRPRRRSLRPGRPAPGLAGRRNSTFSIPEIAGLLIAVGTGKPLRDCGHDLRRDALRRHCAPNLGRARARLEHKAGELAEAPMANWQPDRTGGRRPSRPAAGPAGPAAEPRPATAPAARPARGRPLQLLVAEADPSRRRQPLRVGRDGLR